MKKNRRLSLLFLVLILVLASAQISFAASAPAPVITIDGKPVVNGTVYGAPITPVWNTASGYTFTPALSWSSTQGETQTKQNYKKGKISTDGYYTLSVTASRDGYTSTVRTVTFVIDQTKPAAPTVSGITSGTTYAAAVKPDWNVVSGTTVTATLEGSPYTKGTAISAAGSHTLVVTATRDFNGLTASTTIGFKIDYSNGDWASKSVLLKNTPEADLMVRSGDVDNFGYGWTSTSAIFDPFSGNNTNVHAFPWTQPADEPGGLDKIMIVSGYKYSSSVPTDGYTRDTKGKNALETINLDYKDAVAGITVHNAMLQLFVDDFQPAGAKGIGNGTGTVKYQVTINEKPVPELDDMINKLDQSGPIGKLITLQIPERCLADVKTGNLRVRIDDPSTGGADGYAIDFVKLLINLKSSDYRGNLTGTVTEYKTNKKIEGATITLAGRDASAVTGSDGTYTIRDITAGQIAATAAKDGYKTKDYKNIDITAGSTTTVNIVLEPNDTSAPVIVLEKDIDKPTTRNVNVTATVSDDNGISTVKYAKGTQTSDYFEKGGGTVITADLSFSVDYDGKGYYTVYARDTSGNSSVRTIEVNNIYRFGGTAIQITPVDGDQNARFHVTLKYAVASQSILEFSTSAGVWVTYTAPFKADQGTTVLTREVDHSITEDPKYQYGESRTLPYVISTEAVNTLQVNSSATLTVTVNSSKIDPANPDSAYCYVQFTGLTDALTIDQIPDKKVTHLGGDAYLLEYKVTAKKAGFNGIVRIQVKDVTTIAAPIKIKTVSTKGIM